MLAKEPGPMILTGVRVPCCNAWLRFSIPDEDPMPYCALELLPTLDP
jgi:hypothetical protein